MNRRFRVLRLIALAAAAGASCMPKSAETDTSADVAAIRDAHAREAVVLPSGNVDTMMSVYAPDVIMMPPGEQAKIGSDAVRQWIEATFREVSITSDSPIEDVQVAGDWGIVRYTGTLTISPNAGGQAMTETIKGIHVFRRQPDGSWKIAQDVWNTDAPPAPPAQPSRG